jgi:hypothetical protein
MSKLSGYKNIIKTDFPAQYQDLVDQLGQTINNSFQQLFTTLNNQVTINDNLNATLSTFTIVTDKNGAPVTTTSFKLNKYQTVVNGFIVINAVGNTNAVVPTGPVQILSWGKTDSIITIKSISGLAPNSTYKITVLSL